MMHFGSREWDRPRAPKNDLCACASAEFLEIDSCVKRNRAVSGRRVNTAEGRRVDVGGRIAPLRLIQKVDDVGPQRQLGSFRDRDGLAGRAVEAKLARPSEQRRV